MLALVRRTLADELGQTLGPCQREEQTAEHHSVGNSTQVAYRILEAEIQAAGRVERRVHVLLVRGC